ELASEPRHHNKQQFILNLLERIRDLPDPEQWSDMHLDRLLNIQEALNNTFAHDLLNWGVLAALMTKLLALLVTWRSTDVHSVIIDNQIAPYIGALREEIRNLATAEIPRATRDDIEVLDDYLEVVDQSTDKRINLKRVDNMAGRIRRHRIGALVQIER